MTNEAVTDRHDLQALADNEWEIEPQPSDLQWQVKGDGWWVDVPSGRSARKLVDQGFASQARSRQVGVWDQHEVRR